MVQHSNTYPFDCREHANSWICICVWVQIRIDCIRIDICCCIVIMIPWQRPCNVVLIVTTSCSSLLDFRSRYCSDPFQELNRKLETRCNNQVCKVQYLNCCKMNCMGHASHAWVLCWEWYALLLASWLKRCHKHVVVADIVHYNNNDLRMR